MRLCYIAGSFPPLPDGVGDFAWHISRLLNEMEYDHLTAVLKSGSHEPEGFSIIFSDFTQYQLISVKNRIIDEQPDLILIEYPCKGYGRNLMINLLPALLKLTKPRLKIAIIVHEYANYTIKGKTRIAMMSLVADMVFVTDKKNYHLLSRLKNNVKAVLPVPPQIPLIIKNYYHLAENGAVFAYWGYVRHNKGLHLLIEAFGRFVRKYPEAKLKLLTGLGDSDYEQKIQKQIAESNLSDNIIISGFLADRLLSEELSASDICVLPFTDGISDRRGTLKAALAMGIPVISTKTDKEYSPTGLIDEKNILLCEPNPASLHSAMEKLLDDSLREKIGVNALSWSKYQTWQNLKEILRRYIR
jgi:glycosyltransferase involved in cell wall biosynthesis